MADLRTWHDKLLAEKPDGVNHDAKDCRMCATSPVEGAPVKTYTEEEVRATVAAAVDSAVSSMRSELDSLKSSLEAKESEAEIEARISEAKTPLETQVADLQAQLDAAVLEAQNEKARADGLEAEKAAAQERATLEARQEERVAKVREVANFPEEYLTQNAERFAAMSDEDFEARLDEYRQIAVKKSSNGAEGLPATSVLTATSSSSSGKPSALREFSEMRRSGIDPRTLSV